MQRRGSIEGAGHDMPQAPMLPPEPINMGIKNFIRATVKVRDMYICFACSIPVVIAARRSQGESSIAQPEPRIDAELAFSEVARVFQDRATILQRVAAEQWPQPWGILRRPIDASTRGQHVLAERGRRRRQ